MPRVIHICYLLLILVKSHSASTDFASWFLSKMLSILITRYFKIQALIKVIGYVDIREIHERPEYLYYYLVDISKR